MIILPTSNTLILKPSLCDLRCTAAVVPLSVMAQTAGPDSRCAPVGQAFSMLHWRDVTNFCPGCGAELRARAAGHAKRSVQRQGWQVYGAALWLRRLGSAVVEDMFWYGAGFKKNTRKSGNGFLGFFYLLVLSVLEPEDETFYLVKVSSFQRCQCHISKRLILSTGQGYVQVRWRHRM